MREAALQRACGLLLRSPNSLQPALLRCTQLCHPAPAEIPLLIVCPACRLLPPASWRRAARRRAPQRCAACCRCASCHDCLAGSWSAGSITTAHLQCGCSGRCAVHGGTSRVQPAGCAVVPRCVTTCLAALNFRRASCSSWRRRCWPPRWEAWPPMAMSQVGGCLQQLRRAAAPKAQSACASAAECTTRRGSSGTMH